MKKILPVLLCGSIVLGGCAGSAAPDSYGSTSSNNGAPPVGNSGPISNSSTASTGSNSSASSSGDKFEAVGTNPFTMVAHDPLSTFAADVDTASYDIFRRDIQNANKLPNSASIRLEEFVNYFDYGYTSPTSESEHPFAITLDAAPHILDVSTSLLRVGIQGDRLENTPQPDANIVFLIDISGSMGSPDKLPLLKMLLTESLELLKPTDRISIITYSGVAKLALESTPVKEKIVISQVVNNLRAGGSTNGSEGIQWAYEQAANHFIDNGINHIIMCTDGDFNVWPSSDASLIELIEEKRETGVTFTSLGFGSGNLNDRMMEATSNAGNGIYSVITSADNAIDYAKNRLIGAVNFIAKDVKIQVEFNPQVVSAYRLLGYENRALNDDDFNDDTVDAGEVGAGHSITALYEVAFSDDEIPNIEGAPPIVDGDDHNETLTIEDNSFVKVSVRYKAPNATVEDTAFELEASLTSANISIDADESFKWAAAIASFAEILKGSPYADADALDIMAPIFEVNSLLDSDRLDFYELFKDARILLSEPQD